MNATYDTETAPAPAAKRVHVRPESGGSAPVCWADKTTAQGYAARTNQLIGKRRWSYCACDCPAVQR